MSVPTRVIVIGVVMTGSPDEPLSPVPCAVAMVKVQNGDRIRWSPPMALAALIALTSAFSLHPATCAA